MKKIIMMGLMLASAFALTNCSEEFVQQIETPETDQVVGVVPFEIYASALQTKTANDGMSTVWVENDQINVFHAEAGAASYVNDGVFAIYKQNLADGLFQGALKQPLTASAYDWYFFYPYTVGMKTPAGDAVVTLAGKTQTQKGNSNMAHIAGENYPMCAVVKNVAAEETPAGEMKHMTALVAINVQNKTSKPMTVVSAGIRASESLVGTYYMDFTGEEVVYTPSGDQYVSNTANLEVVDGEDIAAGSSAKFYIAVKPFTAEAGSRLTVYVNGSQKTITIPETTEFEAGKIKTVNVPVVKMKNSLKTSEDIQAKHFEAGDNTDPFHSATINGVKANNVVVMGTETETGKVVLKGSISDFVNMNELGFFASSWTGKQGALAIDQVAVQFPAGMIAALLGESVVMTAEEIAALLAEQSGQEIDLDKLMFKPVAAGTFTDGATNHTLTILDEEIHYYGITEDEINAMVASTGLTVDDLRAIINGEESLEDTLIPILESLGADVSSVESLIPIIEQLMPEVREAKVSVTLKTVAEDQAGNTYDPRIVIWGMNIYFK
jgi:hypothetical protein